MIRRHFASSAPQQQEGTTDKRKSPFLPHKFSSIIQQKMHNLSLLSFEQTQYRVREHSQGSMFKLLAPIPNFQLLSSLGSSAIVYKPSNCPYIWSLLHKPTRGYIFSSLYTQQPIHLHFSVLPKPIAADPTSTACMYSTTQRSIHLERSVQTQLRIRLQ